MRAGLPAIHGLVVLNDPATGVPVAILDAGPITAERTAAVSGVAIARFAEAGGDGRPPRVAILGAGVQARSHLPVLGAVLPGCEVALFDRHAERAAALAALATADRRHRLGARSPRLGPRGRRRRRRRRDGRLVRARRPSARR